MNDQFLSKEGIKAKYDTMDLVASVDKQYIIDMDKGIIKYPTEFLKEAGRRNLLGVMIPKKYGGRGLNWVDNQGVYEELGKLGYIFPCTFGVSSDLIPYALVRHGSEELIERVVVPLAKGEKFACECLTEPRGGSDFFGTSTMAEDKGDHFIINGQKRFIVGAEAADYFFVYARTDHSPDTHYHDRITAFIVERSPGVTTDYIYGLMGNQGGGAARVSFKDVRVPKKNIVGKLNGGHDVFNTMMVPERLGTAQMTIGTAAAALDVATRYTTKRKQFGRPIRKWQLVSGQIAEAAMLLDVARASCNMTARLCDDNSPLDYVRRQISQTKWFTTEACQKVSKLSMQVMGGIGYTDVFPVERYVRELALASIWTGTSEMMNLITSSEWYKEFAIKEQDRKGERDYEFDAPEHNALDEKIYDDN